jgi:hypothetical protein
MCAQKISRRDKMTDKTSHVYEVRPRKDRRGFDLTSDALPFGRYRSQFLPRI